MAQRRQAACKFLYALDISDRSHLGDGRDLFGVGLDAALGDYVP